MRIVLGCGCLVVLAAAALVLVPRYGVFRATSSLGDIAGRLEEMAARTREIEVWERRANANPYVPPPDGVIAETRLLRFLGIRRSIFAVYERHRRELAEQSKNDRGDARSSVSEAAATGGKLAAIYGELRLAQAKALVEAGMSEEEYRAIQWAVYKTAWAAEADEHSGKMPSEAVEEARRKLQEGARKGLQEARAQGVPGLEQLSEEDERRIEQSIAGLDRVAEAMQVPAANVALFRKHEMEIMKYAMTGLELLGL